MGEREQVMLGFGEAPKARQAGEEKPGSMELRPLAARMRPRSLEEVVGQEGVLGEDKPLRRALKAGRLPSLLLWGPPGCGKTSLAELLAAEAGLRMEKLSAVTAGVKELRELLERVRGPLVLFVDEIHRWNKAQQDGLLAMVEEGRLVLIGATTENPGFQVNPALRSRCWLLKLEALEEEALGRLLERALTDKERGLGRLGLRLGGDAKRKLWALGGGDARRSLGILERAALSVGEGEEIDGVAVEAAAGEPEMGSDRGGEGHYDMASALIKAMRGSDPEASLYWLARLIEGGEDPMFLARRIVIAAAEEVGLADPRVLGTAVDAMVGLERIGMPEGRLLLGMAALSVATAPKSNASYEGINAALAKVREGGIFPVPLHLRNAPTKLAKELGHGQGYRYPHAEESGFVAQEYLPEGIGTTDFYRPKVMGAEKVIGERMKWWEGLKQKEKGRQ